MSDTSRRPPTDDTRVSASSLLVWNGLVTRMRQVTVEGPGTDDTAAPAPPSHETENDPAREPRQARVSGTGAPRQPSTSLQPIIDQQVGNVLEALDAEVQTARAG